MDAKFQPAVAAIKSGDVNRLRALIVADVTLATSRSGTSHPTLLQCLVLNPNVPNHIEMARMLIDAGAELTGPLGACGSCDNAAAATLLLDKGAAVDGSGGWSPLEEALYWHSRRVIDVLLQRGASIHNLRIASGLGRTDLMEGFFTEGGDLRPEAGKVNWPWGDLDVIESSNFNRTGKDMQAAKFASFAQDRQGIIDNAFVYACMHGHIPAAQLLLERGAQINAIAGGFDYSGTGLHYAALNGHRTMCEWLIEQGADVSIQDPKVSHTPAGWAEYGGHPELKEVLTHASDD